MLKIIGTLTYLFYNKSYAKSRPLFELFTRFYNLTLKFINLQLTCSTHGIITEGFPYFLFPILVSTVSCMPLECSHHMAGSAPVWLNGPADPIELTSPNYPNTYNASNLLCEWVLRRRKILYMIDLIAAVLLLLG